MFNSKKPQVMNYTNPSTGLISNAEMRRKFKQVIAHNFEEEVDVTDKGTFVKKTKRQILSPSTMNYQLSKFAMSKIPDFILDQRREIGTNLMLNLEKMFQDKLTDVSELETNERDTKNILNLLLFFVEEKIKILAVEKYIHNGQIGGYIDAIGLWNGVPCIFEIKCRNKQEIRKTDIIQACTYKSLLWNATTYILLLDDNGKVSYYQVHRKKDQKFKTLFDETLRFFIRLELIEESAKNAIQLQEESTETEADR